MGPENYLNPGMYTKKKGGKERGRGKSGSSSVSERKSKKSSSGSVKSMGSSSKLSNSSYREGDAESEDN